MPPTIADYLKQDSRFAELEQQMVAQIGRAESVREALEKFNKFGYLLPDWKFVLAANKGGSPGSVANRTFSDGSAIRSLFATEHAVVLDQKTFLDMAQLGKAQYSFDYSIGLDTQALSYLSPFLGGQSRGVPKDFLEVFNFIAQDQVNVDPLPYCMENTLRMLDNGHADAVYDSLLAYHRLRTIDAAHLQSTGKIRSKLSAIEIATAAQRHVAKMIDDCRNPIAFSALQFRHGIMYMLLLKITTIQIGSSGHSFKRKLITLLQFMDEELGTVYQRELLIAAKYFQEGQDFRFFGKIQKNGDASNMLKELKSMSWDFWHVRHLEEMMITLPVSDVRYYFSAILTFDKRYIDLLDANPLKAFAFNTEAGNARPYYSSLPFGENTQDFEDELLNRFFSSDAVARRQLITQKQMKQKLAQTLEFAEQDFLFATKARRV